jgi:hypothetical protein
MLLWCVIASFLIFCVKKIDIYRLRFLDGILIGGLYFIVVPMFVILFNGRHSTIFRAADFVPSEDIETVFVLMVGLILVGILSLVGRGKTRRTWHMSRGGLNEGDQIGGRDRLTLFMGAGIFVFLDISFLILQIAMSGRLEGGSWSESSSSVPTVFIIVGGITNFLRTSVYGVLLYLNLRRHISNAKFIILGAIVSFLDIATTFNRISIVYFLISLLIVYRRRIYIIIPALIMSLPFAGYASLVWGIYRTIALTNGYNLDGLMTAFHDALNFRVQDDIDNILFSTFESANIVILNYVVNHIDGTIKLLYGSTFFGRSFLFFLPSTLWPDKPAVFGTIAAFAVQGDGNLSLNTTLFGEAYANFYWFWPIPLAFMLILLNFIFEKFRRFLPFAGEVGAFVGVAAWRFDAGFFGVSMFSLFFVTGFTLMILTLIPLKRVRYTRRF